MYRTAHLELREAQDLVESVLKAAAAQAQSPIAVAVVDREGTLITFARMDGAPGIVAEMALNKAYTAARLGRSTRNLSAQVRQDDLQLPMFGNQRFTYFGGGVPIGLDGQIVGGLGVSGRTEEEDNALSDQALQALSHAAT
jgi:glc operon protein GlcG